MLNRSQVSGFKNVKGLFSFTSGHLWPYKLFMGLLQAVVNKGVNLQCHTLVTHVSSDPDPDGLWTVETARGSIKARNLIFATNAYTAGIAPLYTDKIVPSRGICSRIVVPPGRPAPLIQNSYGLYLGNSSIDYLIPRPDGSIVVGGARSTFFKDRKTWQNVVDDGTLIEPAKNYFDGFMQRHFNGWEASGAYTDKVWTGSKFLYRHCSWNCCIIHSEVANNGQSWATHLTLCHT
jgi:glycine/D-amino acid oxidase-like deaminating enzyme